MLTCLCLRKAYVQPARPKTQATRSLSFLAHAPSAPYQHTQSLRTTHLPPWSRSLPCPPTLGQDHFMCRPTSSDHTTRQEALVTCALGRYYLRWSRACTCVTFMILRRTQAASAGLQDAKNQKQMPNERLDRDCVRQCAGKCDFNDGSRAGTQACFNTPLTSILYMS